MQWVFERVPQSINLETRASMDETILNEEIYATICAMPKDKMPSLNGIPMEFYLIFHDLLIPLLHKNFNHVVAFGELPEDLLNGDIILLPKLEDPTSCNHKCPITLLNLVYKIFTTIWQLWLSSTANSLVTWNQSAFLRDCSIQHTVLLCNKVLHFACTHGIPLVFLKIDFKKAFNSL